MITPAGKECKHFFGDYFRGRNVERCRLLEAAKLDWSPSLCEKCPVPDILQANACEHQTLTPHLEKPLFFMKAEVRVSAHCSKCQCDVEEPAIGCGQCVNLPIEWVVGPAE
jgi:hypothetical protein